MGAESGRGYGWVEPGGGGASVSLSPHHPPAPELPGNLLLLPRASGVVSGVLASLGPAGPVLAPALRAAPSVPHSPDLFDQPLLYQPSFLILPTPYLILVTFYRELCALWLAGLIFVPVGPFHRSGNPGLAAGLWTSHWARLKAVGTDARQRGNSPAPGWAAGGFQPQPWGLLDQV